MVQPRTPPKSESGRPSAPWPPPQAKFSDIEDYIADPLYSGRPLFSYRGEEDAGPGAITVQVGTQRFGSGSI